MVAASDDVKLIATPKSFAFAWVESPNNVESTDNERSKSAGETSYAIPRGSRTNTAALGSDADKASRDSTPNILTVKGEEVAFVKYIPHRSHTSIDFAVYIVDSSGKRLVPCFS
jgi:hypothetical protein